MTEHKEPLSIWYFVGLILTAYGALIMSVGIYDLVAGIKRATVMAELHAGIWWGGLLLVLGIIYLYFFSPGRKKRSRS